MTIADMEKRQAFYWQIRKDFATKHGRQPTIREVEREAKAIEDQRKAATRPAVKVVVKAINSKTVAAVPVKAKVETKSEKYIREARARRMGWLTMKREDYRLAAMGAMNTDPEAYAAAIKELARIEKGIKDMEG